MKEWTKVPLIPLTRGKRAAGATKKERPRGAETAAASSPVAQVTEAQQFASLLVFL